jgi:hypothetical protein
MKTMPRFSPLVAALFLPLALAAHAADKRETRAIGEFTAIGLSAPVNVHVTQGERASLALEGPESVLEQIETVVEDRSLKIRMRPGSRRQWNQKVQIHVTAARIEALSVAGSGDIIARSIRAESLKASISGSGDVRIGGKVDNFAASIAGSGDIRAGDLDAERVSVSIAGSGDATVRARQTLSVNVAGSGDVRYYGEPSVAKTVLGSGSVRRAKATTS